MSNLMTNLYLTSMLRNKMQKFMSLLHPNLQAYIHPSATQCNITNCLIFQSLRNLGIPNNVGFRGISAEGLIQYLQDAI